MHALGVCMAGGACIPGGLCMPRGCACLGTCVPGWACTPPCEQLTDACENITLAQTSFAGCKHYLRATLLAGGNYNRKGLNVPNTSECSHHSAYIHRMTKCHSMVPTTCKNFAVKSQKSPLRLLHKSHQ